MAGVDTFVQVAWETVSKNSAPPEAIFAKKGAVSRS